MTENRLRVEPCKEALTDAVSEEENEAEDGEALPFVQDADVQSVCEDNDASDLVDAGLIDQCGSNNQKHRVSICIYK